VLPWFERVAPWDVRPRDAVAAARAFARGEVRIGEARRRAVAAHAAARAVVDPAAVAAARAAGHAAATAHMATHAVGAAAYAIVALRRARPNDPVAGDALFRWAVAHASSDVRRVLATLPPRERRGGELGVLVHDLRVALTAEASRAAPSDP
jgi:hypothetical protein